MSNTRGLPVNGLILSLSKSTVTVLYSYHRYSSAIGEVLKVINLMSELHLYCGADD